MIGVGRVWLGGHRLPGRSSAQRAGGEGDEPKRCRGEGGCDDLAAGNPVVDRPPVRRAREVSRPRHFDLVAPLYDRFAREPDVTTLVSLAGLPASGPVLDVGGGTGRVAQTLRDKASSIVIADEAVGMLRRVARKPGLLVVACDAENLPFPRGVFRAVIVVDAFHHLRDQQASLEGMLRVLSPDARLVIEEPDIRRTAVRLVALGEKLVLMRSRFRTAQAIVAMLERLGAAATIRSEGHTIWVTAQKPQPGTFNPLSA